MRTRGGTVWRGVILVFSELLAFPARSAAEQSEVFASLSVNDLRVVQDQMADWWSFWYQQNDNAAAKLQSEFDQAWMRQSSASLRPGEDAASFNRRYDFSKALFLCSWKTTHALQANPKPLFICNSNSTVGQQVAQEDESKRQGIAQRLAEAKEKSARAEADAMRAAADREAKFGREVGQFSNEDLCIAYRHRRYESARDELTRRRALTVDEWHLVDSGTVKIGMSELGLLCTMGDPAKVNRTVTAAGTRKQYVYSLGAYVYVENGRVVAFQD